MPPSPPSLRRVNGGRRPCLQCGRPTVAAGRPAGRPAGLRSCPLSAVSTPSCTADSAASHVRRRRHGGRLPLATVFAQRWFKEARFARGAGCGGGTRRPLPRRPPWPRPPSSLQMPAWQGRSPAYPAAWCWAAGRAALAHTRRAAAWANARTCTIAHARRPAPGFVCGHWQFPRGCGPSLPRLEPSSSGSKNSLIC